MENQIERHDQFLTMLKHLVDRDYSGTVFVRTENNRLAIIGIREGDIVYLSYGTKRGVDAIPLMREIDGGTFRITKSTNAFSPCVLPDTGDVLSLLQASEQVVHQTVHELKHGTAEPNHGAADMATDMEEIGKGLCLLLGEYMGPIAQVICQEQLEELGRAPTHNDLRSIITRLSREIDEPAEAQAFVHRAYRQFELHS